MMHFNLPALAKTASRLVQSNAPVILTVAGVTGTVTTAVLASKATLRAADVISAEQIKRSRPEPLTKKEQFQIAWKLYIPAVAMGTLTITSIIGANHLSTRRAAALAAAYSLSEKTLSEYKDSVLEVVGEEKADEVRKSVSKKKLEGNPPTEREMIFTNGDDVMCLDSWTGRYFKSNKERIREAVNDINEQIFHSDYATISDFYGKIGLEDTDSSGSFGWNTDGKLEVAYEAMLYDDKTPCLVIDFARSPIPDPWRFR